MLGSILADLGCPLWCLFLSWTLSVSLNLFNRCRIVISGGKDFCQGRNFMTMKLFLCLDDWLSCEIGLSSWSSPVLNIELLDPLLAGNKNLFFQLQFTWNSETNLNFTESGKFTKLFLLNHPLQCQFTEKKHVLNRCWIHYNIL